MFSSTERKNILKIARLAIERQLETGQDLEGKEVQSLLTPEMTKKRACFVTLKKNIVELRGCIGHVEAVQPLYKDVIENAVSAAFKDDRFFPVTQDELPEIEIEVSVLTDPTTVNFSSSQELLDKLEVGVDGVIIQKDSKGATYLPQVWDEMLEKHNFLSSLCLKAGLEPDDWQKPGVEVFTYRVEAISEDLPALAP